MSLPPRPLRAVCLIAACLVHLALGASAQLDLPKAKESDDKTEKPAKPKKPDKPTPPQRGDLVPHLVCTACYTRNYNASLDKLDARGIANLYCRICRRPTLHQRSKNAETAGELDLPTGGTPIRRPSDSGGATPEPVDVPKGVSDARAASFVFDEVRKTRTIDDTLSDRAVESLVALGSPAIEASRAMLFDDDAKIVLCAARVLLRAGDAGDMERVVERLRGKLPTRAAVPLLNAVVESDPVRATPRLLAELLDHPYSNVRGTAYRHLVKRMTPETLLDVAPALSSKRSTTRERAVELIASVEDPSVPDLLISRLDDPSAKVASRVVTSLASMTDERVEVELLSIAFKERWILRRSAYALLAIIEREDTTLSPILTETHAPALLGGLELTDPFLSGACAAALAGIGFRSPDPSATSWLDRAVPERLVSTVSGKVFHNDFTSVQPHALRRLRLLSGTNIGSDGPAWVDWWIENREHFYPRRAFVFVDPEEAGKLSVHYRSTGNVITAFNLIGETLAEEASRKPKRAGEQYFLSDGQCRDLISLLQREGLFGPQRLPGVRGSRGSGERSLEVLVDGRGKEFILGVGQTDDWFERVVATIEALRDRNTWQRYPDPTRHADSLSLWRAEASWWDEDRTDRERAARMKTLVGAWLVGQPSTRRMPGLEQLEELYRIEGVLEVSDFAFLRDLLLEERFLGPRSRKILELSLAAASSDSLTGGTVSHDLADDLVTILYESFGNDAGREIAAVFEKCGTDYIRAQLEDERPLMRAIGASVIAKSGDEADTDRLMGLLEDPDVEVQIAAVLVLGEQKIEKARTELLVRSRVADRPVRIAALRSIGRLGGEYVLEALIQGRSDPDPIVRQAAVEGLAVLGDPRTAPLLVSLLSQGPSTESFDLARKGLVNLGPAAHAELLATIHSPAHRARRHAALILSEQCVAGVTSTLIGLLTDSPNDDHVARELAVLSCIDMRPLDDPSFGWWEWWDTVVHDDALAWFRTALELEGLATPSAAAFEGNGTLEGALFLTSIMDLAKPHLVERARRELSRMMGKDIGQIPSGARERAVWSSALREVVRQRWEQ